MAVAAGGGVPVAGTLAADAKRDSLRSLTAVMDKLEIDSAVFHDHPIFWCW